MPKEQRRGRRIAMSPQELDVFLGEERTCRVATTGPNGPHNSPLWFVWDSGSLWLNSIVKSQRWTDISRNPQASVVIDAGNDYGELRGAELIGRLVQVGEAPRTDAAHAELARPETLFAVKYSGSDHYVPDGRHGWLRLTPEKIVSWDFRKMGALSA
jgi:Pyridoxamine 5'-phosphate oxidase